MSEKYETKFNPTQLAVIGQLVPVVRPAAVRVGSLAFRESAGAGARGRWLPGCGDYIHTHTHTHEQTLTHTHVYTLLDALIKICQK